MYGTYMIKSKQVSKTLLPEARNYGAVEKLILKGLYVPSDRNVWRLRILFEVNL